ncbi:MAG: acetyl-CoA C-acyltransferase [Ilumatobacteraceae bacterium]
MSTQREPVYIVDAVRSPVGRAGGGLAEVHPADLGAAVIAALIDRTGIDPGEVDDVMVGNVDSVGPQAGCLARTAWLVADMPEHVPGTTIDRRCGSSQQAVHFAAQAILSGQADMVVAGGIQSMSQVPMMQAFAVPGDDGFDPFTSSPGWVKRYGDSRFDQFDAAERIAERFEITRGDMEAFALESHRRAIAAAAEGRFDDEIVEVAGLRHDECPRVPDAARVAALRPLREGGRLTAAVSCQLADAAAMLLIASESAVARWGLDPLARITHMDVSASDPLEMLSAPIPATERALRRAALTIDDIDLVENNEAFASVVLAWERALGADPSRVNVSGGAIALGHPLGATGARLMTTMAHELHRRGAGRALQTMCERGGMANVTVIEHV